MAGNALDFLINIQQKLTGGNVAGQLGELEKKLKAESAALAALERQMAKLQRGKSVDIESYRKLQGAIDAKKASVQGLQDKLIGLTQQTEQTGGGIAELGDKLQAVKAGPIGAVIAAIVALITVLAIATYKLAAFALTTADAHRSFLLTLEAAAGSKKAFEQDAAAIEKVAHNSALAKDQVEAFGHKLAVAGLSGKTFEETLQSLATLASVVGPEAAEHLQGIVEKSKALGHFEINPKALKGLGISMEELAKQFGMSVAQLEAKMKAGQISVEQGMAAINKAVKARFGDVAAKQALSFAVQLQKLRENLAALFQDVKIEAFLKALHEVLSVFDSSTASGKALKLIVTQVFSGLFNLVAKAGPYLKTFLQGIVIGLLLVYIYAMRVYRALQDAFGGSEVVSKATLLKVAMYAGVAVVAVFVTVIGLLVAALLLLAGAMLLPFAPFIVMALLVYAGFRLVEAAVDSLGQKVSGIKLPDLGAAAGSMVDGFVGGIESRVGSVIAATSGLGNAAADALRNALGIHSPSTVAKLAAVNVTSTFSDTVEDGQGDTRQAFAGMVDPDAARGAVRAGKGSRGVTIGQIGPFYGVGNAGELVRLIEERVTALFERLDISGPEPEGA